MNRIDVALLVLRIGFGLSLSWHGVNKIRGGIAGTAGWFASIGFRWPHIQAVTAAVTEVTAGVLLALGLLSGAAASAMIALMIVAIVTVHWKVGYFIFLPNGGWEYCAAIAFVGGSLAVAGPGSVSIDSVLDTTWTSGPWWIVPGVVLAVCHLALSWRPAPDTRSA